MQKTPCQTDGALVIFLRELFRVPPRPRILTGRPEQNGGDIIPSSWTRTNLAPLIFALKGVLFASAVGVEVPRAFADFSIFGRLTRV